MRFIRIKGLALALGLLALMVGPILAEEAAEKPDSDQLALDVANAQEANRKALTDYSWHTKTALSKDGQEMVTSLEEMRFNSEGKLESTHVGGESHIKKQRGLRGRRQKSEMEEMQKYLQQVLDLSFQYIFMSKGTMVDVFDKAKITESEDAVTVAAEKVFVDGDKLDLSVDPKSHLSQKLSFTTHLDADTINGVVDYTQIEGGPVRVTKLQLEVPEQAIKIVAETYDWIEQK